MTPISGLKRGTMAAALLVLSTGACAQRVAVPPAPPVAQQVAPVAPVTQTPASRPPVATPPAARSAPTPPVAPRVATVPPPKPAAPKPVTAEAPTGTGEGRTGDFRLPESNTVTPEPPAPPKVTVTKAPKLGGQFQVTETASADYGSTSGDNPTPDTAPDIKALVDPDEPLPTPAPEATEPPVAQESVDVAPVEKAEDEPAFAPLSALTGLFPPRETNEEETDAPDAKSVETPSMDKAQEPATGENASPKAANLLDPDASEAPENPYPGGFADDRAYETAQVAQPGSGYVAARPFGAPAFDPNAPVTIAILTPDSDSRPSIRALAKGLSQAAALSARELGNRQIVLRGYDTGGNPAKAQAAAQQAITDGAQLIIGPLFSTSAAAVAPVAQGAGVPVIAFTTDQSVLRRGVYSVGYLPDAEVDRMLSYAAQRGISKIGLMSPDTPYGGIVYRTAQNTAPGYGIDIATVQPIGSDFAGASESAQRFAEFYEAVPDTQGVLIATNGKPLQAIAAYLAYNDVLPSQVRYMGLGIWDDPETFREATLRGGWFPGLDPALKAEFERRYSSAYSGKPPAIAALAYDGVKIAGALLQRSQSTGQPAFTIQNIENPTGFRGMSGLFRFLPNGRNQRLLTVLKVGRRQFEVVDPAPETFSRRVTSITGYSQ